MDAKVDLGASAQLPPAPSAAVATTNNAAASQSTSPSVTGAVAAPVPGVGAVSQSIDKNTTAALVGAVATSAATAAATGTAAAAAVPIFFSSHAAPGAPHLFFFLFVQLTPHHQGQWRW